jgi:hypothetical protein
VYDLPRELFVIYLFQSIVISNGGGYPFVERTEVAYGHGADCGLLALMVGTNYTVRAGYAIFGERCLARGTGVNFAALRQLHQTDGAAVGGLRQKYYPIILATESRPPPRRSWAPRSWHALHI